MRVALVLLALAQVAAAPPEKETLAVIVGANVGASDDEPLRFAESDARRVRDLLVQLGGVRAERALVVTGGDPADVLAALTEARGRAAELAASGRRVVVLFYYSGHGDAEALHLPRGTLRLADVRREIARIPAALRLSILDACRTGGRAKGIQRGPAFALAAAPDAPHGTIELRASAEGEAAQESDELGGAVFTHFLLSGLRGGADVDGDGRVTLAELYSYTYRRTLLRTGAGSALQHPTLATELAGAGEIVLSEPAQASAFLEVPGGADRYLVFALPSAAVVGELVGEGAQRLALPAGRFLVARRRGAAAAVATVDLSWGGRRALHDGDFRPIAREELVARGGRIELRPWRLEARGGLEFAPGGAEGLGQRAGAGLTLARGALQFELELAFVRSGVQTDAFDGEESSITGGPAIALRGFFGAWTLLCALGVEARWSWEHLVRPDAARAMAAGLPATEDRSAGAVGPRAELRAALPLGHDLSFFLSGSASALVRREVGAAAGADFVLRPLIGAGAGVGYAF